MIEADTEEQRELLALIAEAFNGDDWFDAEDFDTFRWIEDPVTDRPVLVLDDGLVAMGVFADGRLGATYEMPGQLRKVLRYHGQTEDGGSEWESTVVPAGDPTQN